KTGRLRLPGRAFESLRTANPIDASTSSARGCLCNGAAQDHADEGALSQKTAPLIFFKARDCRLEDLAPAQRRKSVAPACRRCQIRRRDRCPCSDYQGRRLNGPVTEYRP